MAYTDKRLRAATTLHSPVVPWHVTAVALFFLAVPAPLLVERTECHGLDVLQDLTLALLLDAVNQLIKDPRSWSKLRKS